MNTGEFFPSAKKEGEHVTPCERCGRKEISNGRCLCGHWQYNQSRLTKEEQEKPKKETS